MIILNRPIKVADKSPRGFAALRQRQRMLSFSLIAPTTQWRCRSPICSPIKGGSCAPIRRRFNALDCFAAMVKDQEVGQVPIGQNGHVRTKSHLSGNGVNQELAPLPRLSAGYKVISQHLFGLHIRCVEGRRSVRCGQIGNPRRLRDNRERREEGQRGARGLLGITEGRPRLLGSGSYPHVSRSWS